MSAGNLVVVSAPSGAGKTTLVNALRAEVSGLAVSVSHTTRAQRPGERDGVSYFFVAHAEFERMVAAGEFLEHARVFDHYYGTARSTVERLLSDGVDVLLEIDWQGARLVKAQIPDCLSVFVLPPSREALAARLRGRAQDSDAIIDRRMRDAISEMSHYGEYDFLIVNDVFDDALRALRGLIVSQRLKTSRQSVRLKTLLESLLR